MYQQKQILQRGSGEYWTIKQMLKGDPKRPEYMWNLFMGSAELKEMLFNIVFLVNKSRITREWSKKGDV